jgi:hypothetical protein
VPKAERAPGVSDRVEFGEDLTIPFIFVADGESEPPELAAFKARYPDWFSIPATYVPYSKERRRENSVPAPDAGERRHPRYEVASFPPPQIDRRPRGGEPGSALRAFQRANAVHPDPVNALRALRDTPEAFADEAPAAPTIVIDALDGALLQLPINVQPVNYFVTNPRDAARGLGMSPSEFRRAIHSLKDGIGLSGDENVQIHIPTGDAYFNGEIVGNLHDE